MDGTGSRLEDRLRGKPGGGGGSDHRPRPECEALPGAGSFQIGRRDPLITAMGKRLAAEDCGRYEEGPSPARRQAGRRSPGQSRSVHPMKLKRT
ncbi:hypothetical protein AB0D37_24555 [Streptomyces sp. NPDC048384]|uniref:hypothetical protein n=1 Tax=Streptomyces sp. NPDC048384 TaxID=3155487 RepID=UPI00342C4662